MMDLNNLSRSLASALGMDDSENKNGDLEIHAGSTPRGDIHRTLRCRFRDRDWFVKWGGMGAAPLLEAEADALAALDACGAIRVPQPLCCDNDGRHAWLVLPFLQLGSTGDAAALGHSLATLHRCTNQRHGWDRGNFIGSTPQNNPWTEAWPDFWWQSRLAPQFELARRNGYGSELESLEAALRPRLVALLDHEPDPSLLHGDLWGGNHGYTPDGEPLIFDPASYYGDRETDLAMMRLFGGFAPEVFTAYEKISPLPEGHEQRAHLYQLYHLINHLNLFGSSWLGQIRRCAGQLVAL